MSKCEKSPTFDAVYEKKKQEDFDLEEIKKKALEQVRSGKSLYGKDGEFAPMLKTFFESALEGELYSHLDEDERKTGNRRNGNASKIVETSDGPVELETSRDRSAIMLGHIGRHGFGELGLIMIGANNGCFMLSHTV